MPAKQISMMRANTYSGWLCRDTGVLALSHHPPEQAINHEAPALAELLLCSFQTGDYVRLRLLLYPDQLQATWIGPLAVEPTALRVGTFDVTAELEKHLGKFILLLACTLPQEWVAKLEAQR